MIFTVLIQLILIARLTQVIEAKLFTVVPCSVCSLQALFDVHRERSNIRIHTHQLVDYVHFLLLQGLFIELIISQLDAILTILIILGIIFVDYNICSHPTLFSFLKNLLDVVSGV